MTMITPSYLGETIEYSSLHACRSTLEDPTSIIFTHNMEIALIHPPVGLNLYVLSTISDAPIGEVIRGILPFLILLLIVLGIITYVPALTMWLPNLVYGH